MFLTKYTCLKVQEVCFGFLSNFLGIFLFLDLETCLFLKKQTLGDMWDSKRCWNFINKWPSVITDETIGKFSREFNWNTDGFIGNYRWSTPIHFFGQLRIFVQLFGDFSLHGHSSMFILKKTNFRGHVELKKMLKFLYQGTFGSYQWNHL